MQDFIPANETLEEAIEQLVVERINVYGAGQSEAVDNAYTRFDAALPDSRQHLPRNRHSCSSHARMPFLM